MNIKFSALILLLFLSLHAKAETETADTTLFVSDMQEVVVSGGLKQFGQLSEQPMSAQALSLSPLRRQGIESLKNLSQFVPNLYYPEYGSRLTSAIFIRGVGSRSNTPAVGLYVDDVAVTEKSAFDFSLADATHVEVLRGPQSTLYGRNTMGGLIKVYTPSPLQLGTSTQVRLSAATGDGMREAFASHSHILTDGLGLAVSGFYRGDEGYNRNTYLDRRSNGSESGGGKLRLTYQRTPRFSLDFQSSAEYSDEDAYDYYDVASGLTQSNFLGGYRRTLVNNSLKMETQQRHFTLTSVTSYQFLKDRMNMDQDYSPAEIFGLEQRQRSHSVAEEIVIKSPSTPDIPWLEWTAGAAFAYQSLHTTAPVTFFGDGIQSLIQSGIDRGFSAANEAMNPMGMSLAMSVTDPQLIIDGTFDTPLTNLAAFAQTRFKDILTRGLDLTAGLRLDHEHRSLDYATGTTIHSQFTMSRTGMPAPMVDKTFATTSTYEGTLRDDQTRLLPRFALSYRFDPQDDSNLLYASVTAGLRSGGYNIQMFSDLLQASLRNDMMRTLAEDPQLGPRMANYVTIGQNPAADEATTYKPETSWNYEVGAHLRLLDKHLTLQTALYYIRVHNQQITRFAAAGGLGRQVLNAGESQSYGLELSAEGWLPLAGNPLRFAANYGFCHATFTDYDAGQIGGAPVNYDGNHLPFAPEHTMSLAIDYAMPLGAVTLHAGANTTGAGRIYWTEDNGASQHYYQLLGATIGCQYKHFTLDLWGRNLTGTSYVPFYFESLSHGYAQRCRPRQLGFTLTARF